MDVARWIPRACAVVALALPATAAAQTAAPLLPTGATQGSRPGDVVEVGAYAYFAATDREHGPALWRTGPEGTELVRDLRPGPGGAPIDDLVAAGGALYFVSDGSADGTGSPQLWRSDGTTAGTVALTWFPGAGERVVEGLTALGSTLYFAGTTPGTGTEVWRVPPGGTPELVGDLNPGAGSGCDHSLVATSDRVFWRGTDGVHGTELATVAHASGAPVLLEPQPGRDIDPIALTPVGDRLFYVAGTTDAGEELWTSDGTAAGTRMVEDLATGAAGSDPEWLTAVGARLWFTADDGQRGTELYRVTGDGRPERLTEPQPGPGASDPAWLTASGSRVFFTADDGTSGEELWSAADGTSTVTARVVDGVPGADGANPRSLTAIAGGAVVYTVGRELWRSDGTAGGTTAILTQQPAAPSIQGTAGGRAYLRVDDGRTGIEPWVTDGTASGTRLVADINRAPEGDGVQTVVAAGGRAFFAARSGLGTGLLRTDGTAGGTRLLAPLASPEQLEAAVPFGGGALLAVADEPRARLHLWRTDGSAATPVGDLSLAGPPVVAGEVAYVGGSGGGVSGLHRTDGVDAPTLVHADPLARPQIALGSRIFFLGGVANELWSSDGTAAGTAAVTTEEGVVVDGVTPGRYAVAGGLLYFVAGIDRELWRTDGTPAGTRMLRSSWGGEQGRIRDLATIGDGVVVALERWGGLRELWRSNGTAAGTTEVLDLGSPDLGRLTTVGDGVYFAAGDGAHGEEVWRTDGTTAGTVRVAETAAGAASGRPAFFTPTPLGLYFSAFDADGVRGLYRMTPGGAVTRVAALGPGDMVEGVALVGERILFQVRYEGASSAALWQIALRPDPVDGPDEDGAVPPRPAPVPGPTAVSPALVPRPAPLTGPAPRGAAATLRVRAVRLDRRRGTAAIVVASGAGRVRLTAPGVRTVERRLSRAGSVTLTVRPGRTLARALRRRGRAEVRVSIVLRPSSAAAPVTVRRSIVLRR